MNIEKSTLSTLWNWEIIRGVYLFKKVTKRLITLTSMKQKYNWSNKKMIFKINGSNTNSHKLYSGHWIQQVLKIWKFITH